MNFTLYSPLGAGERKYLLHLPTVYSEKNDEPAPLILVFHALGQTTMSMEEVTRFSDEDTNRKYVVVYPEGINARPPFSFPYCLRSSVKCVKLWE